MNGIKLLFMETPVCNYTGFNVYNNEFLLSRNGLIRSYPRNVTKNSFFRAACNPIDPPFDFGVGKVNVMDWFYPLAYTSQPWRDLVIWETNGKDERWINIQNEVTRYICGDKILASTSWHTKAIMRSMEKLSRMISLIVLCTNYYEKREDIDWNTNVHYTDTVFEEPLTFEKRDNIPHQIDESKYGVLLWDYGKKKIDTDTVSERELNAKGRQLSQKRN
ncbi:hypothetical protein H5410_036636 [Solanum commersonii]|uniref:Uncharacterized protein n=1 Tax=Solanum commersonii TaxID=4109 RepID=A0A9J5Y803_SOLCO|nr:hypothetical protein H5410_036636 [Solanum commersonii]